MNNKAKYLAIGLVFGGLIGIVASTFMDGLTMTMGIVFGGVFGLIIGLAIGTALDRQTDS